MTTQNIIDAWDSGVEPYNATNLQAFSKADGWQTLEKFTTRHEAEMRKSQIETIQPLYKGKLRVFPTA